MTAEGRPSARRLDPGQDGPAKPRQVRVPDRLWDRFRMAAAYRGETPSVVLRRAMAAYLAEHGDSPAYRADPSPEG